MSSAPISRSPQPASFFQRVRATASSSLSSARKTAVACKDLFFKKATETNRWARSTQVVVIGGPNLNPLFDAEDPTAVLQAITLKANEVLTGLQGLQIEPEEIQPRPISPSPATPPPSPADAAQQERTRPRPPGEVYERQDWVKKIDETTKVLSEKLGQFGILWFMKTQVCGIRTANDSDLLGLIHAHSEEGYAIDGNKSLWTRFTEHYQLSWTQLNWWKAGFVYFWGYSFTSLVPVVSHAYLKGIVDGIRGEFSKGAKSNLKKIFSSTLNHTELFLRNLNQAAIQFANESGARSFDAYILERETHSNPSELYLKYSRAIIDRYPVTIPFFESGRKIPYLGKILSTFPFTWIEKKMNQAIRYVVREWILPPSLESAIADGLDAVNTLSFKVQLTDFIKDKLTKFKSQFDPNTKKPKNPDAPKPRQLDGTEKLPQVVDLLMDSSLLMLAKNNHSLMGELLKKRDARKREMPNEKSIESQIYEGIAGGLCDGAHVFFNHLTDNSEELLYQLWKLSGTFFEDPARRRVYTPADYIQARESMKKEARNVFDWIIPYAVNKKMEEEAKSAKIIAEETFETRRRDLEGDLSSLSSLFTTISSKVRAGGSDIQRQLGAAAKTLKSFAEKAEGQIPDDLTSSEKKAIHEALTPVYHRIDNLADEVSALHQEAHNHSSYFSAVDSLQSVQATIESLQSSLNGDFELAKASILDARRRIYFAFRREEIGTRSIRETEAIDSGLRAITPHFDELLKIRRLISQIDALYDDRSKKPFNLLAEGLNKRQRQKAALASIRPILKTIEDLGQGKDSLKIKQVMDTFITTPSEANKKNVLQALEKIRNGYQRQRATTSDIIRGALTQFNTSISSLLRDNQESLEEHSENLTAHLEEANKHLQSLEEFLRQIVTKPEVKQLRPSVAGAIVGGVVGLLLGPTAAALVGVGSYMSIRNLSSLKNKDVSAIASTTGASLTAATIVSLSPLPYPALLAVGVGSAATGVAGANLLHGAKKLGEEEIWRHVDSLFNNSCDLVFQPSTIRGAITRTMLQMS